MEIITLTDVIKFVNEYWDKLEGRKFFANRVNYYFAIFSGDDNFTSSADF